jgi:hypothetical protein
MVNHDRHGYRSRRHRARSAGKRRRTEFRWPRSPRNPGRIDIHPLPRRDHGGRRSVGLGRFTLELRGLRPDALFRPRRERFLHLLGGSGRAKFLHHHADARQKHHRRETRNELLERRLYGVLHQRLRRSQRHGLLAEDLSDQHQRRGHRQHRPGCADDHRDEKLRCQCARVRIRNRRRLGF